MKGGGEPLPKKKIGFFENWKKDFKISWRKITGKTYLMNEAEVELARKTIRRIIELFDPSDV